MKLTGIKRGQAIELEENLNIPDGSKVVVELLQEVAEMSIEEKLQKMKEFLEQPWSGKAEFIEIMAEIDTQRHSYYRR